MPAQAFQLIMRSGPTPGKVFELNKPELTIGRDMNNDIVINDPEVSRKHARIALQAGSYVIEDMGSTNGTAVNGMRLMGPHALRPGESINLGENIIVSFDVAYDVNATLVSTPIPAPVYAPYVQPPVAQQPAPQPVYSGQVPPGPAEPYYPEPETEAPRKIPTWLIAGCGCLIILLCVIVVGMFAFDYLNLYCKPPFNILFYCPVAIPTP